MKKIFRGATIAQLDEYTLKHDSLSVLDLVERAAQAFVYEFNKHYDPRRNEVFVFAGPGNNGADALAIARLLLNDSYRVQVVLFNVRGGVSTACEKNRERFVHLDNAHLQEVTSEFAPPTMRPDSVIIDGLFGTGLNRPLDGGFASLVKFINDADREIVSIDIPSGLYADENEHGKREQAIIKATHTFTFECPKLAFLMQENSPYIGEWTELAIGLSEQGKDELATDFYMVTDEDMANLMMPRDQFSHKGDYGHALLVAGHRGRMGAACLAARAALRTGLGKLTVHLPATGEVVMQTAVPEAMTIADASADAITQVSCEGKYPVVGVGPGLGTEPEQAAMLKNLIMQCHRPMVLDADALNIMAEDHSLLDMLPEGSILTPHAKELERLTTFCHGDFERLQQARALSANHKVYVLLKGPYTATCMPSGKVVFNITGNPGMATAGSGDVLTGIITSLLAQGYPPAAASVLGAYLHGLAGDIYAGRYAQPGLIASDLVEYLPQAFKQLSNW